MADQETRETRPALTGNELRAIVKRLEADQQKALAYEAEAKEDESS